MTISEPNALRLYGPSGLVGMLRPAGPIPGRSDQGWHGPVWDEARYFPDLEAVEAFATAHNLTVTREVEVIDGRERCGAD